MDENNLFSTLLTDRLQCLERSENWLAKKLGIHTSSVNRWTNGQSHPGDPTLVTQIADLLQINDYGERRAFFSAAGYSTLAEQAMIEWMLQVAEATVPPFQVPNLPFQGVIGRQRALADIVRRLQVESTNYRPTPPLALIGMGGVGKTTLAAALGHDPAIESHFKDGILWASVGPKPTLRHLLQSWGNALGLDLSRERDAESCQERLRQLLHHRTVLLIVDDLWDEVAGNYFTIGGPHCRTLFTTREPSIARTLTDAENLITVDVLDEASAILLLRRLIGESYALDREIAAQLCKRLGYLPLALTLAGRLLARETAVPSLLLRKMIELTETSAERMHLLLPGGRTGLAEGTALPLKAILGMSVDRLSASDQERFALLSILGAEPLEWEMGEARAIWQCSQAAAEETLANLINHGLLNQSQQRYTMHTLLCDYAEALRKERRL